MLVETEDGPIKWNFSKYYYRKERSGKSKYHIEARRILCELFPNSSLYEEVSLPTDPVTYSDFFIPDQKMFVEVHGEQHYSYIPYFHKSKLDFYKAKARDKKKIAWFELNDFRFIELDYKKEKEWKTIILTSFQS